MDDSHTGAGKACNELCELQGVVGQLWQGVPYGGMQVGASKIILSLNNAAGRINSEAAS
jgi:hypothetical protein